MTPEQISAARAIIGALAPSEWLITVKNGVHCSYCLGPSLDAAEQAEAAAAFILAARDGWPQALDWITHVENLYHGKLKSIDLLMKQLRAAEQERDQLKRDLDRERKHCLVIEKVDRNGVERRCGSCNALLIKDDSQGHYYWEAISHNIERRACQAESELHDCEDKLRASAASEKVLVEALEYYADEPKRTEEWGTDSRGIVHDGGARARAALAAGGGNE